MFYYLSFLRPPPSLVSISAAVSITPQIANDLRTEHFEGTADIFYSWTNSPDFSPSNFATKPIKLTTWRGASSAYKEITVPLPPRARDGDSWTLILSSPALLVPNSRKETMNPQQIQAISLASNTPENSGEGLGSTPFPVWSMPISFTSRSVKAGKQEKIKRVYILPTGTENESRERQGSLLKVTEQTSFDLDKVRMYMLLLRVV